MEEVAGAHRVGACRAAAVAPRATARLPRRPGASSSRRARGGAPDERATRVRGRERLERVDVPSGQRRERRADLRLERVVAVEDRRRLRRPACRRRAAAPGRRSRASGSVRTPRSSASGGRPARGLARRRDVIARREHADHDHARGDDRREDDEEEDATARAHAATIAAASRPLRLPAIQLEACRPTESCCKPPARRSKRSTPQARRRMLAGEDAPVLVDVRERDEWEQGRIAGAVHVPRGHLESRIEAAAPDRSRPVLLYCAAGNRSAFAAKTLDRARLRASDLARRRLHRLAAQRPADRPAAHARPRARRRATAATC